MISDDTEHTLIVAESLIESAGDEALFGKALAKRLRRWFIALPAGIGIATAKACCKLMLGVSATKSGVFSAGNGPAMRSAILGVFADDHQLLRKLVRSTTRITHTDPKAELGAFAIAIAASCAKSGQTTDPQEYLLKLKQSLPHDGSDEFIELIERLKLRSNMLRTTSRRWNLHLKSDSAMELAGMSITAYQLSFTVG
jgi:ADP-ribosylglycohydrolase